MVPDAVGRLQMCLAVLHVVSRQTKCGIGLYNVLRPSPIVKSTSSSKIIDVIF